MIVREILTHTEEIINNFDFFNDYADTSKFLLGCDGAEKYVANRILRRLLYRHMEWCQFGKSFTFEHHRSRLARLAIFILRTNRFVFDMSDWACGMDVGIITEPSKVNECGTSCCMLGHMPAILPPIKKEGDNWEDFRLYLFYHIEESLPEGKEGNFDKIYSRFFSGGFGNDKREAATRILEYLEDSVYGFTPIKKLLEKRLSVFLVEGDGCIWNPEPLEDENETENEVNSSGD